MKKIYLNNNCITVSFIFSMNRNFLLFLFLFPILLFSQNESDGNANYGKIKVDKSDLKIFSQAYMHYPFIFKDFDRKARFDTTSFEGRYLDTTYANTIKIAPDYQFRENYEIIALDVYDGGNKEEVWFNFKKNSGYASPLTRNNPEINAFTGMVWVYKGNLTRKEFAKKYVFKKRKSFFKLKKYRQWTDFRIYYDNDAQVFTIQLKNLSGYIEFEAYPRYTSTTRSIKEAQEKYEKIYANYLRTLKKRKVKFDKKLAKRQSVFYTSINKYDEELWTSFQTNYMTEEERQLSREDWLMYYDRVIANELKAMGNATPIIENLVRSIKIDGYKIKSIPLLNAQDFSQENNMTKTLYEKNNGDKLAITNILVVDITNKRYQKYAGSKGLKTISVELIKNEENILIAWLRNGDIGYLTADEFNNIEINDERQALIQLNIINKKIASVQMIRNQLNF